MNNSLIARLSQGAVSSPENSMVLPIIIGVFFVVVIIFVIYAIIKF